MGASRQDVNVSVRGGRRVEIKGVPKAGWAPRLVHGEAVRQVNLLSLRDELHEQGISEPDDIRIEHQDVTEMMTDTTIDVLRLDSWERFLADEDRRPGFECGAGSFCVRAIKLVGLAGTLSWPTQPERTFADELNGRVRVIAGLDQQPILLHSESWPAESKYELETLQKTLGCTDADGLVVVWGAEQDTLTATNEVRLRYVDALDGIPNETRQPFEDGSTDFERILPGPDRMYPDTDSPPQRVTRERVERLQAPLPEPPWIREERYAAADVPRDVIHYLIRRGGARLVDAVVDSASADLRQSCFFFGEQLKGLRRAGIAVDAVTTDAWIDLFKLVTGQPVLWEAREDLTAWMAENPEHEVATYVRDFGLGRTPNDWRERIAELVQGRHLDHPDGSEDQRLRFLLGHAMAELRGKVPANEVETAIRSEMGATHD